MMFVISKLFVERSESLREKYANSTANLCTHIAVFAYRKTSNTSRTLVGNKIVDNSDVVGASPVGATPTTSSFST